MKLDFQPVAPPAPAAYNPDAMWPKQLWPRPQAAAGRAKGQRLARLKSSYLKNKPYLRRVYLAIVEASKKWIFRHRDWAVIYSQLMIYFGERLAEQV